MAVSAKDQIAQMARYHSWATERLLSSIEPLPEDSYRRPCGLFFGSIHGTSNHLLLTDSELWYPRFTGKRSASLPLDAELESDRAVLASRLIAAAARWSGYVDGLSDTALADDLRSQHDDRTGTRVADAGGTSPRLQPCHQSSRPDHRRALNAGFCIPVARPAFSDFLRTSFIGDGLDARRLPFAESPVSGSEV